MNSYGFIDGFNVYHLLQDHFTRSGKNLKWVDCHKLIENLSQGHGVADNGVFYCTATPVHLSEQKNKRHALYCQAQEAMGVTIVSGRFKQDTTTGKWVEKQTDVNIAITLLEKAYEVQEGRFYLITNDTDQIPTAKAILRLFPNIRLYWICPHGRNAPHETMNLFKAHGKAKQVLKLNWQHYRNAQLPDYIQLPSGSTIVSPYV
jgi:uncharacterized LabA/DUF88 family protein